MYQKALSAQFCTGHVAFICEIQLKYNKIALETAYEHDEVSILIFIKQVKNK
jgi:hypothetical protein